MPVSNKITVTAEKDMPKLLRALLKRDIQTPSKISDNNDYIDFPIRFNSNEFSTTDTEDKAIASPAYSGLRVMP